MHDGRLGDDSVEIEQTCLDGVGQTELSHTPTVPRAAGLSGWRTPHVRRAAGDTLCCVPLTFDDLLLRARALPRGGRRALLGIAGSPGAGKTTLAERLVGALNGDGPRPGPRMCPWTASISPTPNWTGWGAGPQGRA
ncbi:hypothetical protein GCM10017687_01660 [Streptomyces echinatus]